jgi:hypothetical protein
MIDMNNMQKKAEERLNVVLQLFSLTYQLVFEYAK